jgi:glycosyltransferase involved in cell wall biosynthesis
MRILVVQESDWIERGPHQSHHLMERMVQRGHEVRVIDYQIDWRKHMSEGLISPWKEKKDVHKVVDGGVTVISPSFLRVPALNYVSLLVTHRLEIKHQIHDFRPDVIVGFGLLNANMAIRQAHHHHIPFVYYIIDELHRLVPEEPFQPFAKWVEHDNMRRSDRVLSINEGLREYSVAMGADPAKTEVIPAGVDLKRLMEADGALIRQKFGFKEDDTVLFFMGWLYPFSGLDEVVVELAKNKDSRLKMMILGKGELWDKLQDISMKNGLDGRLVLEGWKPFSEVPNYLAAADICLLPAKRSKIMENIVPIKMYEYLAAGKVVFATDLHGIRKEFGEGNGVRYLEESRDAVVMAIELMNAGRVKEEGLVGQKLVRNSDWSLMTNRFEHTLNEVINE